MKCFHLGLSHRGKASRGFTLVELLIVIGVIVVLIALLLPSVASVRARARSAECQSNLAQLGLAMNAANRNRSTPVRSEIEVLDANGDPKLDANGDPMTISWADQIEPFLEGENEELFNCPADFQAGNLPPSNSGGGVQQPFGGSFGANNQMHRMQGSDGNKVTLLDLGDGNGDGTNESQFFVTPPGGINNWEDDDVNGKSVWDTAINDAADRHAGNVNALRHDGSVSAESYDDLQENHPASGSGDWVPWRADGTPWEGSSDPEADIDRDSDGIANDQDNCPDKFNPDQGPCEEAEDTGPGDDGGEDTGGGGEDTGGGGEDSTPLEDEGCYDTELGFPEVENFHLRSAEGSYGSIGPFRLDPNFWRFKLISMDDCNNYELWYECWDDDDWDCHLRFQRILSGPDAGKIQLSVKFVTPAYAHYYLYLDGNGTPMPGNLKHFCNSNNYQQCEDRNDRTFIPTHQWLESDVLIESDLGRPCACPPAVDAGADVSISYPNLEYQLLGGASVDSATGLPSEVFWTQLSGPPGVSFSDAASLQPTATFPGEGVYVLKLTGTAEGGNSSDEVQITILPEGSTLYRYIRVKRSSGFGPLFLANVKIINNEGVNVAPMGIATKANGWNEEYAITNEGCASGACYQSQNTADAWWMVEFGEASTIDSIEIKNTCTTGFGQFLNGAQVEALDENQTKIWDDVISGASDGSEHTFNP